MPFFLHLSFLLNLLLLPSVFQSTCQLYYITLILLSDVTESRHLQAIYFLLFMIQAHGLCASEVFAIMAQNGKLTLGLHKSIAGLYVLKKLMKLHYNVCLWCDVHVGTCYVVKCLDAVGRKERIFYCIKSLIPSADCTTQ